MLNDEVRSCIESTVDLKGQLNIGGGRINADNAVLCNYNNNPLYYTLTVSKTGSGTVTSNPAGISCGATCSANYNSGTSVTLTATPDSGYTFAGWSGACTGTGSCTVSMDSSKSVTETFTTTVTGVLQSCNIITSPTCGAHNDYTMGYKFTPNTNGQITNLCGYFNGTKTVKLYDSSYTILASASVTSSNSWSCTSITPVSITSGSIYYVAVDLGGIGGCYQTSISLPAACGNIVINANVYQSPSGTFNASHNEFTTYMYGIADVVFSPSSDTTPPTTSIISPANGATVSGVINVNASASDNVGVTKVELYIDGSLFATDTSSPYLFSWNTSSVSNSQHTLYTKAYDAANNVGTSNTITVTVNNIFDFSLSLNPSSGSVIQGNSIQTTVNASLTSGSTQSVSFSASGLPSGATASFSSTSCNPTCTSTMTITTTAATPTGSYTITITGTGGGVTRTTTYTLTVNAAFDFSMSLSPSSGSVNQGTSITTTATATLTSGSTTSVSFNSCSNLPAGGYCSFSPTSCNPTCTSTATIYTSDSTPSGVYNINITGNGGGKTHSATYTLTVNFVDRTPPILSNIQATGITINSSTISWTTDDSSNSTVYYGTVSPDLTKSDSNLVTSHTITLTGLSSNTTYYYQVKSCNNNGYCNTSSTYNFTTLEALPTYYTLSVSKSGSGTVTSNPAGISCGATCSANYNSGTSVTLTAAPDSGYTFAGWSGACTGTGSCTVSMTSSKSVTATFTILSDTTPPVRSNGQPTGTLSSGTKNTTLSLTTNEVATCKYSTTSGVNYDSMTNTFSTTGGTSHSQLITGLTDGNTYNFYVRCSDSYGNKNTDDYTISFNVLVDTTPPAVWITSPPNGSTVTRRASITISATAVDNIAVTKVEFYVNGRLQRIDTTNPYICNWTVPLKRSQTYQLQAKAYDAKGNIGSSAIVTVRSS
jgi:uncharacterized repeat protein (TIGR02543 family)